MSSVLCITGMHRSGTSLTALVAKRDSVFNRWGWKEPRTVLFLREWKRLIPHLRVLIVWRPCAVVTDSLSARARDAAQPYYSVTADEAGRIWCACNSAVCAFARDYPDDVLVVPISVLIRYDDAICADINRRWAIGLEYTPMRGVHHKTLLNRRATSRPAH